MTQQDTTPVALRPVTRAHSPQQRAARLVKRATTAFADLMRRASLDILSRQVRAASPRHREQIFDELRVSMINATATEPGRLSAGFAASMIGLSRSPGGERRLTEFLRGLRKTMPRQFSAAYVATLNQFLSVTDSASLRNYSLGFARSLTRSDCTVAAETAATLLARLNDSDFVQVTCREEREVPLDYDYEGPPLLIGLGTTNELRVGTHYASKEPETVQWIESFPTDAVFYDIGANIGAFSLIAAAQPNKALTVVSFEAAYHNYFALVGNLIRNQLTARVIPLHFALSDRTSLTAFNYRKLERGSAKSALDKPIDAHGNAFVPAAVVRSPCFALDDAITRFDLPFPSYVKIDVDGHEGHILRGAQRTLADPRVRGLMLEASSPAEERQFREALEPLGFRLYKQQDKDLTRARSRNNYFVRD